MLGQCNRSTGADRFKIAVIAVVGKRYKAIPFCFAGSNPAPGKHIKIKIGGEKMLSTNDPANKQSTKKQYETENLSVNTFKKFIKKLTFFELTVVYDDIKKYAPSSEHLLAVENELNKRGYDPEDLFFGELKKYV